MGLVMALIVGGGVWELATNGVEPIGEYEESEAIDEEETEDEQEAEIDDEIEPGEETTEKQPEIEPQPEEKPAPAEKPAEPQPAAPETPVVTKGKVIALTFDDGPSTVTTPRLLEILKGRGVKATFFVLGNMALNAPEIVRREAAEGHQVASHTPYHHQLTLYTEAQVRVEAAEMERIFREILGVAPTLTRPPYGAFDAKVAAGLGQPMILWSVDPRDWADRNAATVCTRVVSAAFDGAIILVHDIHATTVEAVPCIIDGLRAQGYEFMTVTELAAYRGVTLANGVAYYHFKP